MHRSIYLRCEYAQPLGHPGSFSNITLDWTVPDDLAELPALVGGVEMDFKYKDCKRKWIWSTRHSSRP